MNYRISHITKNVNIVENPKAYYKTSTQMIDREDENNPVGGQNWN